MPILKDAALTYCSAVKVTVCCGSLPRGCYRHRLRSSLAGPTATRTRGDAGSDKTVIMFYRWPTERQSSSRRAAVYTVMVRLVIGYANNNRLISNVVSRRVCLDCADIVRVIMVNEHIDDTLLLSSRGLSTFYLAELTGISIAQGSTPRRREDNTAWRWRVAVNIKSIVL